MVAGTDLWVHDTESFCVFFFNQVASIFHLGGGKIKKKIGPTCLASAVSQSVSELVSEWQGTPMIGLGSDKNINIHILMYPLYIDVSFTCLI